ncbi:MAG: AAA family ATPase [Deltaproteobacteria bacterium]|jgi:hypothetical protein|nr:AAA family ATPase [Deltaproteobacteria bacterium]
MDSKDTEQTASPERPSHSNFSTLIRSGDVYVDKTAIIKTLLESQYDTVLLNRPRRFGKTLLLSTIDHILKGDKAKFESLAIGKSDSKYDWKNSYVIRLDMSEYGKTVKDIDINLSDDLNFIAEQHGFITNRTGGGPILAGLIKRLFVNYKNITIKRDGNEITPDTPFVSVLIDEYDYPFVMNFNNPKALKEIREYFAVFYASLKSVAEKIRLTFITGITRLEEFTSFFGMNRFGDITFDPEYATLCGFTRQEIIDNFNDKLNEAYESLKSDKSLGTLNSTDDMLGVIMDWYDGYSWDGKQKVLNPISVLNFFDSFEFGRYWYDTGSPTFLQELQIKDNDFFSNFSNNSSFRASIIYPDTKRISPESTLLATGYLTVDKAEGGTGKGFVGKTYHLAIPNMEVRISYAQDYLVTKLYPNISLSSKARFLTLATEFCSQLCNINAEDATDSLSSIFAGIPYDYHTQQESFYKSHMNTVLAFARGFLTAEKHAGDGRPDFILETRRQVLVMEVKYVKSNEPCVNDTLDNPSGMPLTGSNHEDADDLDTIDTSCNVNTETHMRQKEPRKWEKIDQFHTLINNGINAAFNQISENNYGLEYLDGTKKVWAVAVSILGRTAVKIEFAEIERRR